MAQQDNQKSASAILRTLREQAVDYDPVDKLLQLQRDLLEREQQYGISSEEFYRRHQVGEMSDDAEIVGGQVATVLSWNYATALSTA